MPGAPVRGGGHLSIWDLERTALEALDISPFAERDEANKSDPPSSTVSVTSPGQHSALQDKLEEEDITGSWALLSQQINSMQSDVRHIAARLTYQSYARQASRSPDTKQTVAACRAGRKVEWVKIAGPQQVKVEVKRQPSPSRQLRRRSLSPRSLSPQPQPSCLSPRPQIGQTLHKPIPSPRPSCTLHTTHQVALKSRQDKSPWTELLERSVSPMPGQRSPMPSHRSALQVTGLDQPTLNPQLRGGERCTSPMPSLQQVQGGYNQPPQYSFASTAFPSAASNATVFPSAASNATLRPPTGLSMAHPASLPALSFLTPVATGAVAPIGPSGTALAKQPSLLVDLQRPQQAWSCPLRC